MAIKDELCIDKRAFEGMTRLQFLRFKSPYGSGKNNKLILPQGLNNLPRKLRLLCWDEFPLRCLPPDFAAEFLVILEMRNSSIEKLWEGSPVSCFKLFCFWKLNILCVCFNLSTCIIHMYIGFDTSS